MKIILSPSKTQDFNPKYETAVHEPEFYHKATSLNKKLGHLSKVKLGLVMKISGDLLDKAYDDIKAFDHASPSHAISTYTGLVYKNLSYDYDAPMMAYLNKHLVILSALYGALKPYDGIKPYRLDMKMSIMKQTLYNFWKKDMNHYFKNEDLILDLASTEFSKMIPWPKMTVGFREYKDGAYKNLATYAKMARGKLLDQLIKRQLTDINSIKSLEFDGYHYNEALSDDTTIIFSRND